MFDRTSKTGVPRRQQVNKLNTHMFGELFITAVFHLGEKDEGKSVCVSVCFKLLTSYSPSWQVLARVVSVYMLCP